MLGKIFKSLVKPIALHDFLIIIAVASILLFQLQNIAKDPGLGWHLKTGERVFKLKTFIYSDNLLASSIIRPWIANQWLSDLILFIIYKYLNWFGLYFFTILSFSYVFLGILYKSLNKLQFNSIVSSLALLLVFKVAQIHLIIRPVTFSFILLALLVYLLIASSNENLKIKDYFKISIIFIFWANMHPTFFIGFLVIGIFGLVELFYKNYNKFLKYSLLGFVALISTFVNPYFYKLHENIVWVQNSFVVKFYNEWQPLSINPSAVDFYVILVFLAFFSVFEKSNSKILKFQILTIIFAVWSFNVIRMLPYFAIFVSVPAAVGLQFILKNILKLNSLKFIKRASSSLSRRESSLIPGRRAFIVIIIILTVNYPKIALNPYPLGPPSAFYPYNAMNFLKKGTQENSKIILFHNFDWGGFITLYGENKILATVDDRSKLLGKKYIFDYLDVLKNEKDYKFLFKELKITHLLLSKNTDFAKAIKKNKKEFNLLFEDDVAVLYKIL